MLHGFFHQRLKHQNNIFLSKIMANFFHFLPLFVFCTFVCMIASVFGVKSMDLREINRKRSQDLLMRF